MPKNDDFILAVKFSLDGTTYEIFADKNSIENAASVGNLEDFAPEARVLKDGKELDKYPETWAGTKITDEDFLLDIMSRFNLKAERFAIEYAHDALRALSERFCGQETVEGTDVPVRVLLRQYGCLQPFCIDYLAESEKGLTAVYSNEEDEGIVMLDPDSGKILADIDEFILSGSERSVLDGDEVLFVSEGFGNWLGECLEPETPEEERYAQAFLAKVPKQQPEAVM